MKFARYLDENTVPEWRKVYIQYRGLKKLIKRVAEHREARLRLQAELDAAHTPSSSTANAASAASSPDPYLRRRNPTGASSNSDREAQSTLASSSGYKHRADYGGTNAPAPSLSQLPPVTLQGTGLRLSSDSPSYDGSTPPRDPDSDLEAQAVPRSSTTAANTSSQLRTHPSIDTAASAASADTSASLQPDASTAAATTTNVRYKDDAAPPSRSAPAPTRTTRRADSSGGSSVQRLLDRSGSSARMSSRSLKDDPPQSLQDLIAANFDDQEAKLFSACDAELERIVDFYEAQEHSAAKKYTQLARQLQELAEHRREYRAKYNISDSDRTGAGSRRHRMSQLLSNLPGSRLIAADDVANRVKLIPALSISKTRDAQDSAPQPPSRFSTDLSIKNNGKGRSDSSGEDDDAGGRRRAQALAKMQASLRGWDDETDKAIRQANKAAAMSHDPEAYAAARKKLKAAVLEYYKFLDTLTNYKILNRTGFAKVMKKFSKTSGVPCTDLYYKDRVAPTILVTSDRVEKLRKATEDIYTAYFEHGNRKQALNRLRAREDRTTHHYSVFRSGFYLGISLCAVVAGLIEAMKPDTQRAIPQWQAILRVYGAEFIPTLFALLFGLNLAWWHAVRINTVFIFEWDVRTTMDHRQFFEIPALLMLFLSCCFWVSFVNPFPGAIEPTVWPTVWLVIVAVLVLNPLPIWLPASRAWFVKSWARVFTAGWKRVEFRDFFLGDELNSVAWSMSNFWYIGCEWRHDWEFPDRCSPNSTYWTAVLLSVPAWLRLGQCIRRWIDSDYRTHLHLVNAGKYSSAVLNNFMYIHYRRNGSSAGVDRALWILFATIYSLWHIAWDLLMDWSLLKPRAKYFLLRNEISFPQPIYYIFILVDVIGRSVWIIYLLPGSATVTLRSFLAALVEMIRRVCWNNLRVENEQIGNTDSFKIMRDLPLPYRQKLMDEGELLGESSEREDGARHKTGIFSTVKLASLRKKSLATTASHQHMDDLAQEEHAQTSPAADVSNTHAQRRTSLIEGLRSKLVPDAKGEHYGKRLDERAVTKGDSGRDYAPRRQESMSGYVDVDSDDEEDGETTADEVRERPSEEQRESMADLPRSPPKARPKD